MIRVVGVGGAGVNAVNRMIEADIEGVEFIAINTDLQSLQTSAAADDRCTSATRSPAGSDPAPTPSSAVRPRARSTTRSRRCCAAPTWSSSPPVPVAAPARAGRRSSAQIAREIGALTVGIVTRPFQFEGTRRRDQAEVGIAALGEVVDTMIVVPNNRLLTVLDRNTTMVDAFRVADDVLRQGVQGISDLVTLPGLINLDFADVRTIMSDAGTALLGIGMGTGESRAIDAAEAAVASPLLETSMEGARSILLSITGGADISLWEVNEAAKRRRRGGSPGREHHLRRDGRREDRERPGLDHGGRDRLRRPPAIAPDGRAGRGAPSQSCERPRRRRIGAVVARVRRPDGRARVHPARLSRPGLRQRANLSGSGSGSGSGSDRIGLILRD